MFPFRRFLAAAVTLTCALALAGCGNGGFLGIGGKDDEILPGTRISVLALERALRPALDAVDMQIILPPPEDTTAWPQTGGLSHHAMHHMALDETPRRRWTQNIGTGTGKRNRVLAEPVVAGGRVFAMDAEAYVSAYNEQNGRRLWRVKTAPSSDDDGAFLGGGLAFDNGVVFATTGFAQVVALNAETGKLIWRAKVDTPIRAAPTVTGGRVFVVTVDNQVVAMAVNDGRQLWTHSGASQATMVMGSPAPAVDGGVAVVAFSNGEIAALRVDNGATLWNETVVAIRRTEAAASLPDISGRPVIDRGRVYAVGHSGVIVAIDLRTGQRVWDAPVAGVYGPWIAGDFLFAVTLDAEVVCIDVRTGRIIWVTQLQAFVNPDDPDERIVWAGPALASDRLIVVGSNRQALSLSPYTGSVVGRLGLDAGATLPPVFANATMFLLNDDGDLSAYR